MIIFLWCFLSALACIAHVFELYFLTSSVEKLLRKNMMVFPVCARFRPADSVQRYELFFFISCQHFQLIGMIWRLFTDPAQAKNMQIYT